MQSAEAANSKIADLKNPEVPECLYWNCDQVCDFFDKLNLPEYKETLRANTIDGKRLIYLDSSHLPKLGIQDFKHVMLITKSVRELLKIQAPYWNRSVSLIPRDMRDLYFEAKSFSGAKSDALTLEDFDKDNKDAKWQPPLTNQGFILPSY